MRFTSSLSKSDRGNHLARPRKFIGASNAFRLFETLEQMQTVLDQYLVEYNTKRPYQGRGMNGRTPITAFSVSIRRENTPQPNPIQKAA